MSIAPVNRPRNAPRNAVKENDCHIPVTPVHYVLLSAESVIDKTSVWNLIWLGLAPPTSMSVSWQRMQNCRNKRLSTLHSSKF
eukprot:797107-Amphidinium_carterae.1